MNLLKSIFYVLSIFLNFIYPISSQYPPIPPQRKKVPSSQAPETFALVFIYPCYFRYGKTWIQILSFFVLKLIHFYFGKFTLVGIIFRNRMIRNQNSHVKCFSISTNVFFSSQKKRTEKA